MTGYREKALNAYGEMCQQCGAEEHIEVHHIDRDRQNNALENLEVLCRSCHGDRHSKLTGERVDVSVPMSDTLDSAIESLLEYNDSKAEYIRESCRARLESSTTQE